MAGAVFEAGLKRMGVVNEAGFERTVDSANDNIGINAGADLAPHSLKSGNDQETHLEAAASRPAVAPANTDCHYHLTLWHMLQRAIAKSRLSAWC